MAPNEPSPPPQLQLLHLEDDPDAAVDLLTDLEESLPAAVVTTVERLSDGLQRLRSGKFHCLILDLDLVDSAGAASLDRIRSAAPDLPIVVLLESADDSIAEALLRLGAQECLVKRGSPAGSLARAITASLARHAALIDLHRQTRRMVDEEDRIRQIIEACEDAMLIIDGEGRVQFANRSAEVMFGRERRELLGQPFGFPLSSGQTTEIDVLRRDGSTGVAEMRVVETRWKDHDACLASLRDVTERRRVETRLARARRFEHLAGLARRIALDLQQVLAPVPPAIDALAQRLDEPADRQLIGTISQQTQRAQETLAAVLEFTQGTSPRRVPLDPADLFPGVVSALRADAPPGFAIHSNVAPQVWPVLGDLEQLRQAVIQIGLNAREASPPTGSIRLSVTNVLLQPGQPPPHPDAQPGAYVVIGVVDAGSGIAPEHMDRIFDPFFTTKELGHGRGLGLAIAQSIVVRHHGFIAVQTELGKGSRFEIYLPARPPSLAPTPAAHDGPPDVRTDWILVVDDDPGIREVIHATLASQGYRTLLARDGTQALGLYAIHSAETALVITDLWMPLLDGHSTIRALKAMNPNIRVIATSGVIPRPQTRDGVTPEFDHFIAKPFTSFELLQAVREALQPRPPGAP